MADNIKTKELKEVTCLKKCYNNLKTIITRLKCKHQYKLYKTKSIMGIVTEFQRCKLCGKDRCR